MAEKKPKRYKNQNGLRKCQHFTVAFKLNVLKQMRDEKLGASAASVRFCVKRTTLLHWLRNERKMLKQENPTVKRRCDGGGRPPKMRQCEMNIITYVKDLHKSGKPLTSSAIIAYCSWRFRSFSSKSIGAKIKWVSHFVRRNHLSNWILQRNGPCFQPERFKLKFDQVIVADVWIEQLRRAQQDDLNCSLSRWVYNELPVDDDNIRSIDELWDDLKEFFIHQPTSKTVENGFIVADAEVYSGDEAIKSCPLLNDPVFPQKTKDLVQNQESQNKSTKAVIKAAKRSRSNPIIEVATFVDVSFHGCDKQIKRKIDRADMDCLKKGQRINGFVLSFFIRKYLPKCDNVHIFCDQIYGMLINMENKHGKSYEDYLKFCDLTEQFDWAKYKYIQIPICQDGHWSFIVISNPMESLDFESTRLDHGRTSYYHVDSIAGYHDTDEVVGRIHRFMSHELMRKNNFHHSNRYRKVPVPTDPQQKNSIDCGLYVIHYINVINRFLIEHPHEALAKRIRGLCTHLDKSGCNKLRMSISNLIYADSDFECVL